MRDTYIVIRMAAWAQYALRGLDGGLGFKNKVSFVDPMPPGGEHDLRGSRGYGALKTFLEILWLGYCIVYTMPIR